MNIGQQKVFLLEFSTINIPKKIPHHEKVIKIFALSLNDSHKFLTPLNFYLEAFRVRLYKQQYGF